MPPPYAFAFRYSDIQDIRVRQRNILYKNHNWECEEECYYFDIVIAE
jgi:hypothetical protein